ncbi:MAG: cell division protein ZapA [Alphaproteobacteria bacterium]|nr:cell division protein ZapA [Alphaproteobacteria bacterium]NDC56859.1 cell division protein ZapA [Alphaproteobacteria bacterium]NDG04579.1 cell division protein ZapA [Alphaproteobacteria bacterium]
MPKVAVKLNGKEYPINCPEGQEERLHEIAGLVDHTMRHIAGKGVNMTDLRLAVMTCMTLADQLLELRDQSARMTADDEAVLASAVAQLRSKVAHIVNAVGQA